jgi:hypothetical protein
MYIEGANRSNYSIWDESIISYADSVFTLNRFIIENNGTSPIYTHLNIVTENFVYNVTVYDISMAEQNIFLSLTIGKSIEVIMCWSD